MTRKRKLFLCLMLVWCLIVFSGCLSVGGRAEPVGLAPGFNRMVRAELIFGLSTPDGPVTEDKWQGFVDEVITPRFRDGLTVIDVSGQWLNKKELVEREKSKIVLILFDPDPKRNQALAEITAQYKKRFKQDSVLLIISWADVAF